MWKFWNFTKSGRGGKSWNFTARISNMIKYSEKNRDRSRSGQRWKWNFYWKWSWFAFYLFKRTYAETMNNLATNLTPRGATGMSRRAPLGVKTANARRSKFDSQPLDLNYGFFDSEKWRKTSVWKYFGRFRGRNLKFLHTTERRRKRKSRSCHILRSYLCRCFSTSSERNISAICDFKNFIQKTETPVKSPEKVSRNLTKKMLINCLKSSKFQNPALFVPRTGVENICNRYFIIAGRSAPNRSGWFSRSI